MTSGLPSTRFSLLPSVTSIRGARWCSAWKPPRRETPPRSRATRGSRSRRSTPAWPAASRSSVHEMALAESMLELVEETARRNGAARVTAVRIELGQLAQVERESLAFCFDAVARGGLANGAALEIDCTPGAAWCMPCGVQVPLARFG